MNEGKRAMPKCEVCGGNEVEKLDEVFSMCKTCGLVFYNKEKLLESDEEEQVERRVKWIRRALR